MKKLFAALLLACLLLCFAAGCSNDTDTAGQMVSVQPVSMLVSTGALGLSDWYAGKVTAGESVDITRDTNKTVQETYVEVGDMVEEGDPLFSYDMEKMQLDLEKLYLDREGYQNSIAAANNVIAELEAERDKAKEEEKLSYTLEIDSRRAEIREAEYNISLKDRDIASMEASMEEADVSAPISGRVMTVDETGSSYQDPYSYGSSEDSGNTSIGFITITDVGRLRVEGTINELNASALVEGVPMVIRSRTDGEQTWTGMMSMVDWDNPIQNQNSDVMVYSSSSSGDEMTQSSKYPFYVELDSADGMILGQHVYIEPDTGEEDQEEPSGLPLPMYYLAYEEDGSAYVWAEGKGGKLEKRTVSLGAADELNGTYEILEGLTEDDYIAFPEEGLEEGQAVERFEESSFSEESGAEISEEFPVN